MSKRMFQVFDEMNVNDDKNKTAACGCCFEMVEAKTATGGGVVTMGVPTEALLKLLLGEYQPILILLDKKEYERLKDQPVDDKLQAAEHLIEQMAKALYAIAQMSDPGDYYKAICSMKSIASDTLADYQQYKNGKDGARKEAAGGV